MDFIQSFFRTVYNVPELIRLGGGKAPADIAKDDPEALKAAIRGSKTAVEFFLQALRSDARDERGYKKIVETHVVPLIAALQSNIDQAHFVSLVAARLGVPETAVQAEVAKAAKKKEWQPSGEDAAPSFALPEKVETTSYTRAAAMILFHSTPDSPEVAQVEALLGKEEAAQLALQLAEQAEELRFAFDALGASSTDALADKDGEAAVLQGLVHTVERGCIEEELQSLQRQLRMSGSTPDPQLLKDLAALKHRQEELRS